jgi:hypothetical protein
VLEQILECGVTPCEYFSIEACDGPWSCFPYRIDSPFDSEDAASLYDLSDERIACGEGGNYEANNSEVADDHDLCAEMGTMPSKMKLLWFE